MKNPIIQTKRLGHEKLLKSMSLGKNHKIIGIVILKDKNILKLLIEWMKTLSINCIILWEGNNTENILYVSHIDEDMLIWSDFLIADRDTSDLEKYMKSWIVPIISKNSYLSSLLSEFNPIKNEGNAFLYEQDSVWQIFYALCRYLENSKFSFDNQNLINNVAKI